MRRFWFVFFRRSVQVRPVHDFGVRSGWQVCEQNALEALVHDLTQFGPVVAAQNFIETVVWRWGVYGNLR